MSMSCPDDGLVFIVSATYGINANTSACGEECCAPDAASDCTEELTEFDEGAWTNLKLACNYNNNCGFQHNPHLMTSCGDGEQLADYLTINYVCSNGECAVAAL